jgi:hypothetical protein
MDIKLLRLHNAYQKHTKQHLGSPWEYEYNLAYCHCGLFWVVSVNLRGDGGSLLYGFATGTRKRELLAWAKKQPIAIRLPLNAYVKAIDTFSASSYANINKYFASL